MHEQPGPAGRPQQATKTKQSTSTAPTKCFGMNPGKISGIAELATGHEEWGQMTETGLQLSAEA